MRKLIISIGCMLLGASLAVAAQRYPTQYAIDKKDDCRAFYDEGVRLLRTGDDKDTVRSAAFTNASLACVTIHAVPK